MSGDTADHRARKTGLAHLIRGAIQLGGGTAMGHLVTVAATPWIAKLYGPEAYGIWAGWLALVGLLASVACLSYETAIALPESDHESLHIAAVAVILGSSVSILCGTGVIVLWQLGVAGPWQRLGHHLIWTPFGALVLVGVTVATQWLARVNQVSDLAKAKIWAGVTTALVQLAMGAIGSASGLIFGDIIGRSAGLWRRLKDVWQEQAQRIRSLRCAHLITAARCYRVHSIWMTPTVLINTLGLQAPVLLMLSWHGEATGGQYSLVQRFLGLPLALLGQSVAQLFLPLMVKAHRSSKRAAMNLFLKLSGLLALGAAVMVGAVWLLNEALLVELLGPRWGGVERFLIPLSVFAGVQLVASTVSQTVVVLGAQKWFSGWVAFSLLATVGGMWIGNLRSAEAAAWGLAFAGGGAYCVLWIGILARLLYESKGASKLTIDGRLS